MCSTLMFLMKSAELHWSTGDESELSKAIRQVEDPLSAMCSWSERDTAGAQERAGKRQTVERRGTHTHTHSWDASRGLKGLFAQWRNITQMTISVTSNISNQLKSLCMGISGLLILSLMPLLFKQWMKNIQLTVRRCTLLKSAENWLTVDTVADYSSLNQLTM